MKNKTTAPDRPQHDCVPWHIAHKITGNGPYIYTKLGLPGHRTIIESDYVGIAEVAGETSEKCLANAAFIVQACNSHAPLLQALQELVTAVTTECIHRKPEIVNQARAALRQAQGGQP